MNILDCLSITLDLNKIDWTAFWTMVVAVVTIALVGISWFQLGRMSRIAQADFVHRFKKDFFNEDTRLLFDLFDDDLLLFKQISRRSDINL